MKLKFYYIIISLLLSNTLFAEITQSEYEALIDHINCEYGKFLLQDTKTKKHLENYNKVVTDSCDFVNMIVFYKTDKRFLKINGQIAYLIDSTKKEYTSDSLNLLYANTIKIFNNNLFLEYIETLSNKADYEAFEEKLIKEIERKILAKPKEVTTALDNETAEVGNSIFDIVTHPYVLRGLLFLFVVWLIRALIKIYQQYNTEEVPHIIPERKPISKEKSPIKQAKPMLTKVEQPKAKPKAKPKKPLVKKDMVKPKTKTIPQFIQDLKDENKSTFYMPPPSISGSFYSFDKMSEFKQDLAMFKFEIVSEKYQICQFFVVNKPVVVTEGMMDFEKYLHPACIAENEPFPAATQIITVKPGVVKRSAKHWRVQQKALIKFV